MTSATRAALLIGVAATAWLPSIARAQANPSEAGGIDDIIVTAQKRSERVQDVPIAISAFDDKALARQKLDSAIDLQIQTPNLLVVGNDRPTIRGIATTAPGADNATGVLLNFAPIGIRPQDEFYDVERIEVLRGPQGTLYGRNTTGGTINLITAKPNDRLGGYATAEVGNFSTVRVQGAVNLPIDEAVQLRLAGFYLKRDGFTRNITTGNGIDGRDQYSLRASLRINAGPDTRIDIMFQHSKEDSTRTRETKRLCKAVAVLGCSPLELGFDNPSVAGGAVLFQTLLGPFTGFLVPPGFNIYAGAPNPTNLRQVAADTDASFRGEQNSLTAEISHQAGDVQLISLTAFTSGNSTGSLDYDNAALPFRFLAPITYTAAEGRTVTTNQLIATDSFISASQAFYQEVRATSSFKGPVNFTLGANYFHSSGSSNFIIYHPSIELFAKLVRNLPQEAWKFNADTPYARTRSWAAFGELYWNLGDATKLTVGLRYTDDNKAVRTRTIFLAAPPPYAEGSGSDSALTGRLVLDHKLTPNNLIYASFARGFKGGGLNLGTGSTFQPEFINAFEIGSKNEFFDRTLQANFSAFYYDYANLQLSQRSGTTFVTVNSNAKVWGLEGEFVWAPVEGLRLNASGAYLNTRIGNLLTVDPANPAQWNGVGTPTKAPEVFINLDGKRLPYAPEFKFSLGAQYTVPIGASGWSVTLRGDYSRQSSYFAREFNTANDRIASWDIANAFLRVNGPDDRIAIEAFVKNIGDNANITNSIIESDLVGSYRNVRILDPRTYGVSTTFRF